MVGSGFGNIFKIPELKRRLLFTAGLLAVYRVGVHVPTPGIDGAALKSFFDSMQGTIFGVVNMFTGGALEQLSVFALGIMPYISASIILQLLTVVIPHLEQLKKEGQQGQKKNNPVHALWDRCAEYHSRVYDRGRVGKHALAHRVRRSIQSRLGFSVDDGHHPHRRNRFHHVAGRADHRTRHRQRYFADHLRRYRGAYAGGHRQHPAPGAAG
jgi:hypothetical protein